MADISTFELLVKRIAPVMGPIDNPVNAPFRRVVQGYFLTIANPNTEFVTLRVRARIPAFTLPSPDQDQDRELFGLPEPNHVFTWDITGGVESGQVFSRPLHCKLPAFGGNQFTLISNNLQLLGGKTAAFKLLPDIGPTTTINLADPRFEVRGYIEIVQLPSIFIQIDKSGVARFVLEDRDPVELYFTPEIRGTFLDNAYPDICGESGHLDFDQIAYSIPTIDGGAKMTLEKSSESIFVFCFLLSLTNEDLPNITGRVDRSGRFVLDDNALKFLEERINSINRDDPNANLNLQQVRDLVEEEINQTGLIIRE